MTTKKEIAAKKARALIHGIRKRDKKGRSDKAFVRQRVIASLIEKAIDTNCPICGVHFYIPTLGKDTVRGNTMSLDRFDTTGNYDAQNVRVICFRCNSLKGSNTIESLRMLLDWMLKGGPDVTHDADI